MARCEDCIHGECCRIYIPERTILCGDKADERCKWFKSTADVVPKSEVDKTIAEWAHLHADVLNKLDNAKAEVAREIFEEIWSSIATHAFTSKSEDYADGAYDTIEWVDSKITEIEKKYIPKDCRDCRYFVGCECFSGMTCNMYEEKKT